MTGESHRSASLRRHFLLVAELLRGKEHDRHTIAARLGIRPPMADRLIKAALTLPGVTQHREGRQRKIRLDPTVLTQAPSYPTAVAACFGSSLWPLFAGSSYEDGIRDALRQTIGRTRRRAVFRDIDRKFWFLRRGGEVALLDRAPLLDEVIEAVLHHRVVAALYTRFSGVVQRLRLEPLSVVVHDHQLYVVARGAGSTGGAPNPAGTPVHPYRFSRFGSVDVLEETFEYPARDEYDPQQVFRDSFGIFLDLPVQDVVLKLHPQWAVYAQSHRWHDSQTVDVQPDGVWVRMRLRMCPELEAWILGFGDQAEVIAPAELRATIARRAVELAARYRAKPRSKSR